MSQPSTSIFYRRTRAGSHLAALRRWPVVPPILEQVAGVRIEPTEPGRPVTRYEPAVPGSSKLTTVWMRGDFVEFLRQWFELDQQPVRITRDAVVAEVENLCDLLALRRFKHLALSIAQEVRPATHKTPGRSGGAERAATESWCERMREKRKTLARD